MAESPLQASAVLGLDIEVAGKAIGDTIQVESVETFAEQGGVSWAHVAIADGDATEGDFPVSSSRTFEPGSKIRISAGYAGTTAPIFEGVIVGHAIEFSATEASRLWVECQRPGPPPMAPAGAPAPLCVTYGLDILELHLETPRVELFTDGAIELPHPTEHPGTHGFLSFQGSALATIGSLLEVGGLGKRFAGDVLVTAVAHRIEAGDWTTEVSVGSDSIGDELRNTDPPTP